MLCCLLTQSMPRYSMHLRRVERAKPGRSVHGWQQSGGYGRRSAFRGDEILHFHLCGELCRHRIREQPRKADEFLIIGIDVIGLLLTLGAIFGFDWIEIFKLNRLTIFCLEGLLHFRLVLGRFSLIAFFGFCAYMAVTCKLFSRREMDF